MYALVSCTSRYTRRSRLVVVATDVHGTVAIKRGHVAIGGIAYSRRGNWGLAKCAVAVDLLWCLRSRTPFVH